MVAALRNGIAELLSLPDGYEVALGNGGTTAFWDAATFGLIEQRSQHLSFGEFSSKFAGAARRPPRTSTTPTSSSRPPGTRPRGQGHPRRRRLLPHPQRDLDRRASPRCAGPRAPTGLVLVDATSAAGGLRFDPAAGRRLLLRPAEGPRLRRRPVAGGPVARRRSSASSASRPSDRWCPAFLDLGIALDNSRKDQTYNTPALATIFLAVQQIEWILHNGGLPLAAGRCDRSAEILYGWAEAQRLRHAVRRRPRACAATWSPPSTSTTRSTPPRSARCCGQTASSTPRATASWAATSCASRCSRRSTPTTSRR